VSGDHRKEGNFFTRAGAKITTGTGSYIPGWGLEVSRAGELAGQRGSDPKTSWLLLRTDIRRRKKRGKKKPVKKKSAGGGQASKRTYKTAKRKKEANAVSRNETHKGQPSVYVVGGSKTNDTSYEHKEVGEKKTGALLYWYKRAVDTNRHLGERDF